MAFASAGMSAVKLEEMKVDKLAESMELQLVEYLVE